MTGVPGRPFPAGSGAGTVIPVIDLPGMESTRHLARSGADRQARVGLVIQPGNERHDTGGHPENPGRFPPVLARLRESADWESLTVESAPAAEIEDLLRAHSDDHVERIREAAENGPTWIDGDTVVLPESFEVALDAAGGTIRAVEMVCGPGAVGSEPGGRGSGGGHGGRSRAGIADRIPAAFALVRPPGHHATRDRAMGFCLFNSITVAARHARERLGIERIAIFDWDVHHGNGTQDILYEDPSVLFISTHQWPLYPGTGRFDEVGAGAGTGFNLNLPMPPGSGDDEHLEAFEAVVGPVLERFDPGLILISAGQDGHVADPLSSQQVTVAGYHSLAASVAKLASALGSGVVAVQEGGYNPETLPRLDHAIIAGLGGFAADLTEPDPPAQAGDIGWPERLEEIRRAQRPYWPGL